MPLYEYECPKCQHRFERIQKFSDPPVERCPSCQSKVRKLLSSPAIQFKGSGWYVTDYAGKGKAPAAEEKGEAKGEAPGEAKAEKKAPRHKDTEKHKKETVKT
jgi:putative FmdB family regulatory protein